MEMNVDVTAVAVGWQVHLAVILDRSETSRLFLAGDVLISWPTKGLVGTGGEALPARSSMFLSEIVSRSAGISPAYKTRESAERAARIFASQVRAALPGE